MIVHIIEARHLTGVYWLKFVDEIVCVIAFVIQRKQLTMKVQLILMKTNPKLGILKRWVLHWLLSLY